MTTLQIVLVSIAAAIALLILIIAMQPSEFTVTRATTINSPAEAVFAQVNDFHNWAAWSPWEKLDPAMEKTFNGPESGTGAGYAWVGNNKVGQGRMTILESRPDELLRIKLEFLKPFKATNTTEFTFKPESGKTLVTWSMFGKCNFFFKAFGLFMDKDKMIGGDFERGLAQMKATSESADKA